MNIVVFTIRIKFLLAVRDDGRLSLLWYFVPVLLQEFLVPIPAKRELHVSEVFEHPKFP